MSPHYLSFGIGSLNDLLGGPYGIDLPPGEASSFCLIGPDGTGKSVFSLHLANAYRQQNKSPKTKVFYISTDLRYAMAEKITADFGLARPSHLPTSDYAPLTEYLLSESDSSIGFIDLASDSAGDDWAQIARIISLLKEPEAKDEPRHLVVVDAVEGLETLSGETDAYGQKLSRRARIALLMRLASHKCHLGLIVEESTEYTRLPEEFVVDTVIRLRSTLVNGYTRRTIEIEKARGQTLGARGQHPFQMRPKGRHRPKSEVEIFPSLHFRGNQLRQNSEPPSQAGLVAFGIRHLDSMLKRSKTSESGWPAGRPFALVGETGTFKSSLADAYLAQAVADADDDNSPGGIVVLCTSGPRSLKDLCRSLAHQLVALRSQHKHIDAEVTALQQKIESLNSDPGNPRFFIDQMVIHDQPGPRLISRIENLLDRAEKSLNKLAGASAENGRIRFVFDDLSSFRDAYPDVKQDPLLLPLMIQLIRQHGVSAMFVATQRGKPDAAPEVPFDAALRSLVDGHFLTWHVPFFGETRTAITFVGGFRPERDPAIRELKSISTLPGAVAVDVDPEFEIYDGLEKGSPAPVPLEIRLYAETPAFTKYIDDEEGLIGQLFPASPGSDVITPVKRSEYDSLRDYSYLGASARLPKTLVFQVDEFWKPAREDMFAPLRGHMENPVAGTGADQYEDHYGLFQNNSASEQAIRRRDCFWSIGGTDTRVPFMWDFGFLLLAHDDWYDASDQQLPDFEGGRLNVGDVLGALRLPSDALSVPLPRFSSGPKLQGHRGLTSWRVVLEAAAAVTRRQKARDASSMGAFDVARPAGESFCCLVLEIWLSEIIETRGYGQRTDLLWEDPVWRRFHSWITTGEGDFSLRELLEHYPVELYMTWMLLIEVIDMDSFLDADSRFAFRAEQQPTSAAAARHWYKTACEAHSISRSAPPAMPARLPGFFSTRGDWGLALAAGSRSYRLGARAMDFLSSRRANISRLQQGIGLPTRDIGHPDGLDNFRTRMSYINSKMRRATLGYAAMIELGADETIEQFRSRCSTIKDIFPKDAAASETEPGSLGKGRFYWLYRSRIRHYGHNAKIWQRWLHRVMLAFQEIASQEKPQWRNGFTVYDQLASSSRNKEQMGSASELETYKKFKKLVDFLILELKWHTPRDEASGS